MNIPDQPPTQASATDAAPTRIRLTSVALPNEHGGWSLTLEPALLGLIVVPSTAGVALALSALLAFILRTPLRVVLVDRWRGRRLPRTRLASRVAGIEGAVLLALVVVAFTTTGAPFWWPFAVAAPMIGIELWYDMKSRSRHLLPELLGAIGVASVAGAVVLAGGESSTIAIAVWCVMGARSLAAVPFVRTQLRRAKGQASARSVSDGAQILAIVLVLGFWRFGDVPLAGVLAVAVLAMFHLAAVRTEPKSAPVVGAQQVVLGLMVVTTTALGVLMP